MFSHICCKCFILMLCLFAIVFTQIFQVFQLFFCVLQVLHLNILKLDQVLHEMCMGRIGGTSGPHMSTRRRRRSVVQPPYGHETRVDTRKQTAATDIRPDVQTLAMLF
jgi:hypothetical protein